MTLKQFFALLPKDGWRLDYETHIRRGSSLCMGECPITAIGDKHRSAGEMSLSADELELPEQLTHRIVSASDMRNMHVPTIRRIRRLLLSHCGLEDA